MCRTLPDGYRKKFSKAIRHFSTLNKLGRKGPCWLRLVFRFLQHSLRRQESLLMWQIFVQHMQNGTAEVLTQSDMATGWTKIYTTSGKLADTGTGITGKATQDNWQSTDPGLVGLHMRVKLSLVPSSK